MDKSVAQSYSAVTSAGSSGYTRDPVVDARVIRQAVQDASEADSRAANVVVFGLEESTGESVTERLMLWCLDSKNRLGKV